eukprot:scaffold15681_cov90-Isochrysis_galbana.AAC.1
MELLAGSALGPVVALPEAAWRAAGKEGGGGAAGLGEGEGVRWPARPSTVGLPSDCRCRWRGAVALPTGCAPAALHSPLLRPTRRAVYSAVYISRHTLQLSSLSSSFFMYTWKIVLYDGTPYYRGIQNIPSESLRRGKPSTKPRTT